MADQIVPRTTFAIAVGIEGEARNLKAGIGLMNEALESTGGESKADALSKLHFLVDALSSLQERLDVIATAAYDVSRSQKIAA